ncbi:nodulation protein NodZ [Planctomycetota bacterium]
MNDDKPQDQKYLLVKAKGGMGNRMLCALTGILYGELTGRKIIVDWRDASYSNDRGNTFSRFFKCTCIYPETVLPKDGTIRPSIWTNKLNKPISKMISEYDPDKHSSIRIHRKYSVDVRRLDYDEDIIVFWYYTGRIKALKSNLHKGLDGYAGLDTNGIIRRVLTEQMLLHKDIRQKIDDFKARHWPEKKVIGIHIRHTDRKTNLAKYERHLRRFLKRYPDAHIFLATDNQQVNQDYHKRFRRVFSTPKWFPDETSSMHQNPTCPDKVGNGIEALVDMYLLADCDYLIYSSSSTFSWISRLLSNIPSENVADIDRFNPKIQLKRLIRELVA